MNRTLRDECCRVQGRQTWYIGVEEIPEIVPTAEGSSAFLSPTSPPVL
jgi:hypothetical protein